MSSYSQILSNIKAAMPQLSSMSVTSLFGKMAEAVGQVLDTILAELTNTQTTITNIITQQNYGHDEYYINAAKAYQIGDDLSIDAYGNFYYAIINTSHQIIAQAAFTETVIGSSVSISLKVAKLDTGTGLLIPLDPTTELPDFVSYMQNFQLPGLAPLSIISVAGNTLAFNAAITYNKTYNLTTIQSNVITALAAFQKTFIFNGVFHNFGLENYLVANVPGLTSVYLSGTTLDAVSFSGQTALSSGYFNYGVYLLTYGIV